MNRVILIGRLTKDPEFKESKDLAIARYTLAVDRRGRDENADFISCVVFQKGAEFANQYLKKGAKIAIEGRIHTGSYENRKGDKVYTTDVVVDSQEFCEKKE